MIFTTSQIICHLIGDYLLQSDWMAAEKTNKTIPALVHAITYTIPFVILTKSSLALFVILITHFIIDRWRLARYLCYIKNFIAPKPYYLWKDCNLTGYYKDKPAWLSVWLLIIADNTLHLLCNGFSIYYL